MIKNVKSVHDNFDSCIVLNMSDVKKAQPDQVFDLEVNNDSLSLSSSKVEKRYTWREDGSSASVQYIDKETGTMSRQVFFDIQGNPSKTVEYKYDKNGKLISSSETKPNAANYDVMSGNTDSFWSKVTSFFK